MEEFVHETLKFFDQLRITLETGAEEEKKEALKDSEELQGKLQLYAQKAYEKIGISPEDVKNFLAKGSNFSGADWRHLQMLKKN